MPAETTRIGNTAVSPSATTPASMTRTASESTGIVSDHATTAPFVSAS